MKYTIIYLSLLAMTSISCNCFQEESTETKDSLKIDRVKVDSIDSRTGVINKDALKKKTVNNQCSNRSKGLRHWRTS